MRVPSAVREGVNPTETHGFYPRQEDEMDTMEATMTFFTTTFYYRIEADQQGGLAEQLTCVPICRPPGNVPRWRKLFRAIPRDGDHVP